MCPACRRARARHAAVPRGGASARRGGRALACGALRGRQSGRLRRARPRAARPRLHAPRRSVASTPPRRGLQHAPRRHAGTGRPRRARRRRDPGELRLLGESWPDSSRAGKRCASDLYGGRGGVADLAACEHEPDGRLIAVRPLRPPRGERRARRGCAPVVGAVGCAVGLAFSLERSTAMTSRAITSWRATDVSCAGADASSRQCGEERQNSRAGVERRIVPGCMRDAERLSSARCLGAIWDFASGDQCRRHVGRASGPLSRCWNRRDSMQSREGSWPLLLGLPQHTS